MAAIAERYAARVAAGEIEPDPGQLHAIGRLARLQRELADYRPPVQSGAPGWVMGRRATAGPARAGTARRLPLRRGRPRKDHVDRLFRRGRARREKTTRTFSRIHGGC